MRFIVGILIALILIGLTTVVSAKQEFNFTQVSNLQFQAPKGMSIVRIDAEGLTTGSNQTFVLNAYGRVYTITINSSTTFNAWHTFVITLTYPNGTSTSRTLEMLKPFANKYDVRIQYFGLQANPFGNMQIYIQLDPFDVKKAEIPVDMGYVESFLIFSDVSFTSTVEAEKVSILCITPEEYDKYFKNPSALGFTEFWLVSTSQEVVKFTWQKFLEAVRQIPVAGEFLADGLNFMAIIVGETFYYVKLFLIDNWDITVLTYESIAMMYAISSSRDIFRMFERYTNFHIRTAELIYKVVVGAVRLIFDLIKAVGSLIPFT